MYSCQYTWPTKKGEMFSHRALLLEETNGRKMAFHFHNKEKDFPLYETFSCYSDEKISKKEFIGSTKLTFMQMDDLFRKYEKTLDKNRSCDIYANAAILWLLNEITSPILQIEDECQDNRLYKICILSSSKICVQ